MNTHLLGIDIGTSACKAALFCTNGTIVAQSTVEYPVNYPRAGWAEQDPQTWWNAVCIAIKEITTQNPTAEIAGVGIAGQSWSAIPISAAGEVLCPTPIWMDTRAAEICNNLRASIGEDAIFNICGNPLQPTYSLPKVLWYKENLPDVYAKADKILQSNSYIAYCLTGEITQDISQGYGFQCFNVHTGQWDDALCAEMGLRRSLLPNIVNSHEIIGKITAQAAAACGLREGTPVVAGGLDAACGTLGAGVLEDGQTQEQGGQAGGMSICMEKSLADPRLILGFHVVPERWLLQGGTVGGGGILRWLNAIVPNSFEEMDRLASEVAAGSDGLIFLPYMAGERSPIWNADAKGVFFGLDYGKTQGHMMRASLEGVAFSLKHNLAVAQQAGANVERLQAMGGAANSHLWTQIKSDITGKPIDVPASDTATTWGAAMLAGVATGVYESFQTAVKQTVKLRRSHTPNAANNHIYNEAFEKYLSLYKNLQPLMRSE